MVKLLPALVGGMVAVLALTSAALALEYKEAPAFAQAVAAGTLPPVSDRLPTQPEVIAPLKEIGVYGGVIRYGLRGSSDHNHILRMVGNQGLVRWNPEFTAVVPNLAERWEVNADATEYTFHLRAGMKWSDGTPFTADDVLFNVDDLIKNTEFAPTHPRYMAGGEPLAVEKIDDTTVKFVFKAPYGEFLSELATPLGQHPVLYAKHYCSQFHPNYNDNLAPIIAESGAGDWQTLFLQKCGDIEIPARWGNPDRPTLDPWVIRQPYTGGATLVTLERNPYFWQVDTEGNQLPYIDTLSSDVSQDVESLMLSVIGGNIDFGLRHIDSAANRPVIAENRERGNYRMFAADPGGGQHMIMNLNLAHKDPGFRELFNKKDFRIALSIGMDRQSIIDTVLLGTSEPWQQGDFPGSPFYNEQLSTQFTEFDPDKANALLDGLELKRGDDGVRRMADGRPIKFLFDVIPSLNPDFVDLLEVIEQQWADLGIDMDVNTLERTFFYERTSNANDHDAAVWPGGGVAIVGVPQQLVPLHHDARWGIPWSHWYNTSGAQGEEPPETIRNRMALYDQSKSTGDPEERRRLLMEIAQIAADEFEVMGIAKAATTYGIAKNNLANVPDTMTNSWFWPTPAPALPQTWFYK
ncbi:MAG: ABC transporter substrate-binding protein [Alphaproteobacteria bacterium]|nr:MAG: ABC transporter substrate-binding protein [Alphaproteobacteria bacterium]